MFSRVRVLAAPVVEKSGRCSLRPTPKERLMAYIEGAYEVRPGNRRVVHHAVNLLDTTGAARRLLKREEERKNEAGH